MRRALIRLKTHPGNASGIKEERNLSSRGVDMIVVLKLRKGKEVIPIILTLVDEETEILLQLLIDSLRLSVSLGMISRGSRQFDSEEPVQLPSELGNELGATVRQHLFREAMMPPDMLEV
jgi:hypothetical protein